MRSLTGLRSASILSCCAGAALLSLGALGCSSAGADDASDDVGAIERERGESLSLHLAIAESNVVFSSRVESFSITDSGEGGASLPCRDRGFHMSSKKSLYADGWSVDAAASFSEDVPDAEFREYEFASCRDGKTEVLGWFPKEREFEFNISEQLLDKDYKPTEMPLILRRTKIGDDAPKYYSCNADFQKKLVRETQNAKFYDISVVCKSRSAPTKAERGPIEFISNPGPYAAVASYNAWALPAVASNAASFARVKRAFTGKVQEGTYAGVMSTLTKTCTLKVEGSGDVLNVDHTIDSSQRTRRLALKAENLLGFAEGDVYADPIRVRGEKTGKFAAAEFKDEKGGSFVVRFEENTTLDAKIVRINGGEAYCRRLARE